MVIRKAQMKDVLILIDMWQAMHDDEDKDLMVPRYPMLGTPASLASDMAVAVGDQNTFVAVAENDNGVILGFIKAGLEIRTTLAPAIVAMVQAIWVAPLARRTSAARELIRELKLWIDSVNMKLGQDIIQVAEIVTRPSDRQMKRWLKKGWKPYGVLLWKKIKEDKT